MSEGLNRATVIGHLGRDADLKSSQSGNSMLKFSVAATESYFDEKSKERKEKTEWIPCCLFGKRADSLAKFLRKGSHVCVEGKISTRSWEDKNGGGKRYMTEVVVTNVVLLGGRAVAANDSDGQEQRQAYSEPAGGVCGQQQQPVGDDDVDSLPF